MPSFPVQISDDEFAIFSTVVDDWVTTVGSRADTEVMMVLRGLDATLHSIEQSFGRWLKTYDEVREAYPDLDSPIPDEEGEGDPIPDEEGEGDPIPDEVVEAARTLLAYARQQRAKTEAYWEARRATNAQVAESHRIVAEAEGGR